MLGLLALAACAVPGSESRFDPEAPVIVGVLVPTGSTNPEQEALGQSLANAAQLAGQSVEGIALDIQVFETAGDATTAARAAETALAGGADILVGPFYADETAAVAAIADAAGRRVLSFSNNTAVAGGNVHLLGITFEALAGRLVGFAAAQNLGPLGTVYPEGIEGEAARDAIRQATAAVGAEIVVEEAYPFSVQGITETAGRIARTVRASGAAAIILTDSPAGGLPFITETLRGLWVRPRAVQFLGLQRWNAVPRAVAQPGLQGGWFVAPDPALAAGFAARYQAAYGTPPHPLASLAFDAIAATGAMVAEARIDGAAPFSAERLTDPAGFAGVNGIFRFRADGGTDRALTVFEVIDGDARPLDPAPRSFQTPGA